MLSETQTIEGASHRTISVIMPVYNTARFLSMAVESILRQTFSDFEFIIVNDGSTDGSTQILREYAAGDARIILIEQENTGYCRALNRAMDVARGEFVARMDSDDVSLPDRFALQTAYLREHRDVVVVGGQGLVIDQDGDGLYPLANALGHEEIDGRLMGIHRRSGTLTHPAVMMRRSVVNKVGRYRPEFEPAEDRDLFLRLAEVGRLANLSERVIHYRTHPMSTSVSRAQQQHHQALRAMKDAYRRRGLAMPDSVHMRTLKDGPAESVETMEGRALSAALHGFQKTALKYAIRTLSRHPARRTAWKAIFIALFGPGWPSRLRRWTRGLLRRRAQPAISAEGPRR